MTKPVIPTAETSPYSLPLTHEEFRVALARGWGRAWLHVERHGGAGLHDILLHALLNCQTYDPQIEGDRSGWLMAITDLAGAGESVYAEFIRRVHELPVGDPEHMYWSHLDQRATVLGLLAKRGFAGARSALGRLFLDHGGASGDRSIGAMDIIELDGEQGLVQVASVLGNGAHQAGAEDVVDWFVEWFDRDRAEGEGLRVLEAARRSDAGVEWFLSIRQAAEERYQAADNQAEPAALADPLVPSDFEFHDPGGKLTVEQVLAWIRNAPPVPNPRHLLQNGCLRLGWWGREAGDSDLDRVLLELETAESSLEQDRLLSVFAQRPMPRLPEKVLALAETAQYPVRFRAYNALRHVDDPRVRDLAIRSMSAERIDDGSLRLWRSSYRPGDHRIIEAGLALPEGDDRVHGVLFDVADICIAVEQPECVPLMLMVYAYSPCSMCRSRVVDCMTKLGAVPDWLLHEYRRDALSPAQGWRA